MAAFSAKDVQRLRQETSCGMLDAKKALEATDGDFEAAKKWLRTNGLAGAAKRSDREASQGAVAVVKDGNAAAVVQLKSETDFVAKAAEFVSLVDAIAAKVAAEGEAATDSFSDEIDTMRTTLKENISLGKVFRLVAGDGQVVDTYVHVQAGRGINGLAIVVEGGTEELAHDILIHAAFTKPAYLSRDEVPADEVAAERATIEEIARKEGKPEASLDKIIEGRLNGWFKERCLLEQSFVRDEKQTITTLLGGATIAAFAQVVIGA